MHATYCSSIHKEFAADLDINEIAENLFILLKMIARSILDNSFILAMKTIVSFF